MYDLPICHHDHSLYSAAKIPAGKPGLKNLGLKKVQPHGFYCIWGIWVFKKTQLKLLVQKLWVDSSEFLCAPQRVEYPKKLQIHVYRNKVFQYQ